MTISRKIDKPDHPLLCMDNNDIATVSDHKHLGLVISDNGSWEKHIDMITEKTYKRINILRKKLFILDQKSLEKIYFTFVRPLLEYANVIWDNMNMSLNKKIENVQLEASKSLEALDSFHLITFTWKNVKIEEKNINLFNSTK